MWKTSAIHACVSSRVCLPKEATMFKLSVYTKRSLTSIPAFEGPARRAERAEAAPHNKRTNTFVAGQCNRAIGGGAPARGPARGSA